MPINPLQLPGSFQSPSFDFSSFAGIGEQYKKAQTEALREQTLARLGQGPLDNSAAQQLIASGDMNLAQLGVGLANTNYQHSRDTVNDQFRIQEAARAQANADRSYGLQERTATRADEAAEESSPGGRAKTALAYGYKPGSPEFMNYVLTGKLPEANTTVQAQTEQRKQAAAGLGITPDNPMYNSYVLTGKTPREDAQPLTAGDKEAIRTADDAILANKSAIDSLGRAKELSKQAFVGPTAGIRGYGASFLGESSDLGKGGIATENLTNEVMTNALGQLKAIFGGNPTEGERKILLDLQGSVNKPDAVRQAIFDRATNLARVRLEFNQKRADELRGNTYYKPGNGAANVAAKPAGSGQGNGADAVLNQARDAIARGADRNAVIDRLRQNGVDPGSL